MIFANQLSSAWNLTSTVFWGGLLVTAAFDVAIVQLVRRLLPQPSTNRLDHAYATGRISYKDYMARKYNAQGYSID